MASALENAVRAFDGRHNDVLLEVADELAPKPSVLLQAVRLLVDDDVRVAQGASFVLWTWIRRGARVTPRVVTPLLAALPQLRDKWVRLHIVRCLPLLPLPPAAFDAAATWCERCYTEPLPFLRAWAMDTLHRLALRDDRLEPRARRLREAAQDDPAASVRARLRQLLA